MSAAVDTTAEIDQTQIRKALAMYEGLPGRVSVMYLQTQGAVPSYTSYATTGDELAQAVRDIVKLDLTDEPLGIYLRGTTVAEGVTGRGGSEDSVVWPSFKADLDLGKPGGPATWADLFAVYERANLPTPTHWQHSGGGFYPTWQLVAPVAHSPEVEALAADIEAELRRAWQAGGYTSGVDSCHDAARVWRLAGSVHRKNRDMPITSTIGKVSGEVLTFDELRERVPRRERLKGWDGRRSDPRIAWAADFWKTYRSSLEACKARGRDHFRHTFFTAARNAHRMVAIGEITPDQLRDDLLELVQTFWPGMGFNGDDRRHIHDALNNSIERGDNAGALASPWELRTDEPGASHLKAGGTSADDFFAEPGSVRAEVVEEAAVEMRSGYEIELDHVVRQERLRREARRLLALEDRAPIEVLDFDAFLDAPQVDYLVPRMLWRTGVSRVFGPPGETKSFLLLDLALSLATGTPWRGQPLEQVTVHYVMAEGQAVNTTRALAWMHHHGIPRSAAAGRFKAIPQGVLLTPEGIAEYVELVKQDQPGLIILDTKARMMIGEENSASDSMVMMRAVDALKEVSAGNVCLVDHTGLNDTTRARGSNSVLGATDTEVKVTLDRDTGIASAEVTRDKAAEPGATWPYRLQRVDGVPGLRPGTPLPAVVVPIEDDGTTDSPFGLRSREWWQDDEMIPDVVAALSGGPADVARDIFRVLRYVQEHEGGVTMSFLRTAVGQRPSSKEPSEATARRARVMLEQAGIVISLTATRYALAPVFWGGKDTPS